MSFERSKELHRIALNLIPGGVNSPVRAFKSVGGDPLFMSHGQGPFIYDVDGNRYIDYVGSWGPLILGHAFPKVVQAIQEAAAKGASFGASTEQEILLAKRVIDAVPSVERVRFVNSGTEATMSALRVARGFTGRRKLIKFAGCYHGHADAFLAEAGSGIATLGIPGSAGVPESVVQDTITVPFNDLDAVQQIMEAVGDEVAAIIVEPVACNMGMVQPEEGFLAGLRQVCDGYKALLIFDEVITGFRVALGGAQAHFDIKADLSTFGKIIGGGLPVGAYGGRAEIMETVAPVGPVYQAGTLSGNPLAMAAGIATLEALNAPTFFETLEANSAGLQRRLGEVLQAHKNPARLERCGSIFYLWFKSNAEHGPRNYADIKTADTARFQRFFRCLIDQGVNMAPSAFEVGFVSSAHTDAELDATAKAVDQALSQSAALN
ncbi:MAG: glutamate-1-semialdehyde 2,1-aminomutase [Myxococcota bacterium]